MEFRQLKYFLAVVDSGSISKAAARLFIAQSALSQQILQLEEYLGTTLLHRSSRGVSMTESGLAFYEHAQAIMRQIGYARAAVTQQSLDSPTGVVTLGISPTVSATLALPLFLAARKELPGVILQPIEDATDGLIDHLRQRRLNLAILVDDGQLTEFPRKRIMQEQMFLVSSTQHKRPGKARRIKLKDVLQSPLILLSIQHGVRQRIERIAEEHRLAIEGLVGEVHSLNVLKSAVLAGVGATISPLAPFQFELSHGGVQAQVIHDPGVSRALAICTSRDAPPTRASLAISKLIIRVANDLHNTGEWQGAMPICHDNPNLVV